MLCAISGEQPTNPVVSPKSGHVFEKSIIVARLADSPVDPVNGEDLEVTELIDIKTDRTVRPRPPTLTSIPALLSTFQNEWDAIALETYQLKQQLDRTRQELSTALYQYDAALRVIAKVQKERDEARDALSKVTVSGTAGGDAMDVDGQALPDDVVARIEQTQADLSSTRRKRQVPAEWATSDVVESFDQLQTTDPLYPGVKALAVDSNGALAITGGSDGVAGVYSIEKNEVVAALKVSTGKVTDALWWDTKPIIATSSGHIKVFNDIANGGDAQHLGQHAGSATTIALHPSGDLLASAGVDKTYKIFDLTSGKQVTSVVTPSEILCGQFHPDGALFAVGSLDGKIRLYTATTGDEAAAFDAEAPLQALSFSENGTFLASVVQGQTGVTVWDLRKAAVLKTLDIGSAVTTVKWDYTGQFLAVAGPGCVAVQQYEKKSKKWSEPFRKAVEANGVAWGANAQSLVALTVEGALTVLGAAS